MAKISVRELRNNGGEVIERVLSGETITVTRSGKPVAELRPLQRAALNATALLAQWRGLPVVDGAELKADLDRVIEPRI